jgi:hypothetical protein
MEKDSTPSDEGKPSSVSPIIRVGETIIFKFEGNLRAQVVGYEINDDKVWLDARVCLGFKVPFSQVIGVEDEE